MHALFISEILQSRAVKGLNLLRSWGSSVAVEHLTRDGPERSRPVRAGICFSSPGSAFCADSIIQSHTTRAQSVCSEEENSAMVFTVKRSFD